MSSSFPRINVPALLRFERSAIAAALNLIEDRRPHFQEQALELLDELAAQPVSAHIVGVTGPPGVGKSSLIASLIARAAEVGQRLGVVAVDPSSKTSGGALLGDRSRIQAPARAPVYMRSFAARDRLGGLSREAFSAALLLRHLCDIVLVETVGVGQSETDVSYVADTVMLVVQPFSGDLLQFIKAGVMEIPDILAVNKADNENLACKAVAEVKSALAFEQRRWARPVIAVSATTGLNLDALEKAIVAHYEHLHNTGMLESQRARQTLAWAVGEVVYELGRVGLAALGGSTGVANLWLQQPPSWSAARRLKTLLDSVSYAVQ